jgi:hypothetical protein
MRRDGAWPWLGVAAFVLGYVATWSVQFSVSDEALRAGGGALLDALDTPENQVVWRISSGLGYLSVGCLLWFAAGLWRRLEQCAGGESLLPAVIFGSFLVTGGALIVAWALRAQVFDGIEYYAADPSAHVTINRLSQDTGLAVWAGLGIASAAATAGGLAGNLFPRWFGWFSAVVTALIVLLCLTGTPFPANIPAGIWLLVTSIWAIREPSALVIGNGNP